MSAGTVLDAMSAQWTSTGDLLSTRRSAPGFASFCPPVAGEEMQSILLTNGTTGEMPFASLTFTGRAVIIYGALLGTPSGSVLRSLDGAGQSSKIEFEPSALNAAGDAVCAVVLYKHNNLKAGQHQIDIVPYNEHLNIAIFNATVFDEPWLEESKSLTQTTSSTTSVLGTSTDASSSIGAVNSPSTNRPPIAAIVVPIVVGCILLASALLWWLKRYSAARRTGRLLSLRDQLSEMPPLSPFTRHDPPPAVPSGKTGIYAGVPSPYIAPVASFSANSGPLALAEEKVRLLHAGDKEGHNRTASSESLADPVTADSLAPIPAEMQALTAAMQRAGFSPQALLESLNRVNACADDHADSIPPPHLGPEVVQQPPLYRA